HQLHELRLAQPTRTKMAELVVDASFPTVQDVHRQVLQALDHNLDDVRGLRSGGLQPITERRQAIIKALGVIRSVLQHDAVGSELVEVPARPAAHEAKPQAILEELLERRALSVSRLRDMRHIRAAEHATHHDISSSSLSSASCAAYMPRRPVK